MAKKSFYSWYDKYSQYYQLIFKYLLILFLIFSGTLISICAFTKIQIQITCHEFFLYATFVVEDVVMILSLIKFYRRNSNNISVNRINMIPPYLIHLFSNLLFKIKYIHN